MGEVSGRMTKMVKPVKNLLRNHKTDDLKTWYAA